MNIENIFFEMTSQNNSMVLIIDAFIYLFFVIEVLYLLVFSLASLHNSENKYPKAKINHNIVIIYSVFKGHNIIVNSIKRLNNQDYPKDLFNIITVIDKTMSNEIDELNKLGVTTLSIDIDNKSKGYAIKQATNLILEKNIKCDIVILLDSDNDVDNDMLSKINDAYYSGCNAIQTHRIAKKRDTNIAILEAVSEEINNSIFRKGHTMLGFSSALIGSGMAFDFDIFKQCIDNCSILGFDKQLEIILLRNNIYIEYLESVFTYDEKFNNKEDYCDQRRRWAASQFYNLINGIIGVPLAIIKGKWDYCDKLLQWMMLPRTTLIVLLIFIATFLTMVNWILSIKWWFILLIVCFVFVMAIPNYLIDSKLKKAIKRLPFIVLFMAIRAFKIKKREGVIGRLHE